MIWGMALRVANDNRRLRRENRDLTYLLVRAQRDAEQAHAALRRIARDVDLVACMSRDPRVAAEFVRDAHRIAGLPEKEE